MLLSLADPEDGFVTGVTTAEPDRVMPAAEDDADLLNVLEVADLVKRALGNGADCSPDAPTFGLPTATKTEDLPR